MYQMSQNGISNKDISDLLNEHKIQPKRTEKYTAKLVWSILKKYRHRLERQKHVEVRYENNELYKRFVYTNKASQRYIRFLLYRVK
jgi:arginine/lysine/ornithine decarboxylase